MSESDDREDEEIEEESSVTKKNEIIEQVNHETLTFEHDLAKELKSNLKISIIDQLPDIGPTPYKVAVIGMNELGSATTFLLICRQIATDVIIIDRNAKRLAAEYADLSTCTTFVSGVNIQASNQLASCEGARVVIICDTNDDDDQVKFNIKKILFPSEKTLSNLKTMARSISFYAPNCVLIVAIQPFEITAQLCALHCTLPSYRIIAPGTMIDSAHFRLLIAEKLDISPSSITGIIVGGHGHNNVPIWNSITVGGIHLLSENPSIGNSNDNENWRQIHLNVNQRQEEIINIKGDEVWSISMASNELVECILRNKREIHTVTVNIKGYYDVQTDLFLSIPAIIGQNGVSHLITTNFNHVHNECDFSAIIQNIKIFVKEKLSNVSTMQETH